MGRSMQRNSQYLKMRNTHDAGSLDSEDVGKSRKERELTEKVVEGMFASDDEDDGDSLSLNLAGPTKSERELDVERRKREREKLVEKSRAMDRRETVSKEGDGEADPTELCDRTSRRPRRVDCTDRGRRGVGWIGGANRQISMAGTGQFPPFDGRRRANLAVPRGVVSP